ncbi:MAG TPA: hypothetical protein VFM18_18695 [Methanosarcina sp.]|nr:hypothetical protein [Methanosarcina sp.]
MSYQKGRIAHNRPTTEQFIAKLLIQWPDCPYNLDNVEYTSTKHKIALTCKEHGEFQKWPSDVLNKSGCPKCKKQGFTKDEYLAEIKALLPNMDFSKFTYTNALTPSTVICSKHGEYLIRPNDIHSLTKLGNNGCKECGIESQLSKRISSGQCRHPDDIPEYEKYRKEVWKWSNRTYKKNQTQLGERDLSNHLDHIYSIVDGWNNKVPAEVMGSIHNLRILNGISNRKKSNKSDILLEELYNAYYGDKTNGI